MVAFKALRVLITGCGNIAGAFDAGRPPHDLPYTHAGAYTRDKRFELVACVEPDEIRRREFAARWGVANAFRSIEDAVASGMQFDVISICSPTACHARDLDVALNLSPKLVFCEKPLTNSISETMRIVKEYEESGIALGVNYSRRWDPSVTRLLGEMQTGSLGRLRSAVGYYNKGLLNNGSHMLDLLHLLIGPMKIVTVGNPIHDYSPNDPTVPVWLEGPEGIAVYIAGSHAQDYSFFELQLVFTNGMLAMEDGGLFWRERRVTDSAIFKGYRVLNEGTRHVGEYPRAMLQAIDNIVGNVQQGKALASTGESASVVQQLCEQIARQAGQHR